MKIRIITASLLLASSALSLTPALASTATPSLFTTVERVSPASHVKQEYLVRVDLDSKALFAMAPRSEVALNLPGVANYVLVADRVSSLPNGKRLWEGHVKGSPEHRVALTASRDGTAGELKLPAGSFRLGFVNSSQWITREGTEASSLAAAAEPRMFRPVPIAAGSEKDKPAEVAYPVQFDVIQLSQARDNTDVVLNVPSVGDFQVRYEKTVGNEAGTATWVGYLKDQGNDYRVMITYGPEGSFGNILTPKGEFKLTTVNGKQWLVDVKASKLTAPPEPDESDGVGAEVSVAAARTTRQNKNATTTVTEPATANDIVAGGPTVDVLVLYTPGMKTKYGSQLVNRISQLMALSNQAYVDSAVGANVRLVGVEPVNYTDSNNNSTALSELRNASGAFAGVPALRQKYGADLVALIRPFSYSTQGGGCGVGYIGGYNLQPIQYFASYGFSVSGDGRDSGGTSYYCGEYTFTHELGHNMGSMHDRATVTSQGGGKGAYAYSYGYGRSGTFGTIMSYIWPVVGKFSNPNLYSCAGTYRCGVPSTDPTNSADNSQSLNGTVAGVAAWVPTMMPARYSITGTVSRNGLPLANTSMSITGSNVWCTSSGSNGVYSCNVPSGWSGTVTPKLNTLVFNPASITYPAVTTNQVNRNYMAY